MIGLPGSVILARSDEGSSRTFTHDQNNVEVVIGGFEDFTQAIRVGTSVRHRRDTIALHSETHTRCDVQPLFGSFLVADYSDSESLAERGISCRDDRELLCISFLNQEFRTFVPNNTHEDSLAGYGAEPVSAPKASAEVPASADGDIVGDGTDTAPEATASVEESAATGAAPAEGSVGPHPKTTTESGSTQ